MTHAPSRPRHPLPPDVEQALTDAGVGEAYAERPPYQRNDRIGWIERSKRLETRAKRLSQMLDELRAGDCYMNMAWSGLRTGDSSR